MHLYLIKKHEKLKVRSSREWESKIYKRDAIMKYLWRKDGSIETWYPTHQYSRARSSSEWMSWRMIYGVLLWGYSFVFCFPCLFCFSFWISFFLGIFVGLKFICFPLALKSQHDSKLSSLGPFEAFFKWKGLLQRSSWLRS